jgi:hypothetical protein
MIVWASTLRNASTSSLGGRHIFAALAEPDRSTREPRGRGAGRLIWSSAIHFVIWFGAMAFRRVSEAIERTQSLDNLFAAL